MSLLTPKRVVLFTAAVVLAVSAFANNPSPRTGSRMAFDEKSGVGVMFGGRGAFDAATQLLHDTDETWLWVGNRFVQRFPGDPRPEPRNSQSMVYDSKRQRIVLFGGRREPQVVKGSPTLFNDMWVYGNNIWGRLEPVTSPTPRYGSGIAYDRVNDRIILFGGLELDSLDAPKSIYDTWEYDGSTWRQVGTSGQPTVANPVLAYDVERKETIMMGIDGTSLANVMYHYDFAAKTWTKLSPTTMPACVNAGNMVYQTANKTLFFMGGVCTAGTSSLDEAYEWDGSNWKKLAPPNVIIRGYSQAVAYDTERESVVTFGGSDIGTTNVRSDIATFTRGAWHFPSFSARPSPRSLGGFQTDPNTGNAWLFGGLFESSTGFLDDFWGYRGGQWYPMITTDQPGGGCTTPLTAFDSDRSRLVLTCTGSTIFEFDSSALSWKSFTNLSKSPGGRRFANMVYDRKLKKTVLFGGYNSNGNYMNETWTWDGTAWTQVKTKDKDAPPHRGMMAMWYDPLAEKTILYGGIGRPNLNTSAIRYDDMWSFDGTKWTKLSVTATPGQRLGAQYAVDPVSGKLLLFGGLVAEQVDEKTLTQEFVNDTWQWDGKANAWTKLNPARSPDARENGMMAFDPATNRIVLFGGYENGFYDSDLWTWDGQTWIPLIDQATRRRTAGGTPPAAPPTSGSGD